MGVRIDLSSQTWTLRGWAPNVWEWTAGAEGIDSTRHQATPVVPAVVPGAVQEDLFRAGLLPDWNVGLNAPLCEWVEHRHWEYRCQVSIPADWRGRRLILHAEGLDYAGYLLVDGAIVDQFCGMMRPHEFDLTDHLTPGGQHRLSIVFTEAPHEQGQIGRTSRSRYFKARFAYGWDWCPRLVPLGIWDDLYLMAAPEPRLLDCLPYPTYEPADGLGGLAVRLHVQASRAMRASCRVKLRRAGETVYEDVVTCAFGRGETETLVELPDRFPVEAWWPNGLGAQPLYALDVALLDADGAQVDVWQGRVGFRQVEWLPCEGAPANAEPWLCRVNGLPLFLQGVNWTPVRMTYGSVTRELYAQRLNTYADMGLNILRVWGGAMLEKAAFYDLCDELGIMVWQEFPLSSSGIDNEPPHAPEALDELRRIATSYLWRRGGHASCVVWSGGNELFRQDEHGATPVDKTDPAIAVMAGVAERLGRNQRFVVTSPSGPSMWFDPAQAGQGLHHDIHGPWRMPTSMDEWRRYWDAHDALLVSEIGVPSCSRVELLQACAGDLDLWPPNDDNPFWLYRTPWWNTWELAEPHGFDAERPELERWVALTQELQAEAMAYVAASCKRRFPRCGGVIFWMGHDCYVCPANNSVIEYDGAPKPAVAALKRVFRGEASPSDG